MEVIDINRAISLFNGAECFKVVIFQSEERTTVTDIGEFRHAEDVYDFAELYIKKGCPISLPNGKECKARTKKAVVRNIELCLV